MCRLVMIDDNPAEHQLMQQLFEHYGLFDDAAYSLDGRIIIDFLKENRAKPENLPDLIFLELHTSGFSGWDFLEQFDRLYLSFGKPVSIYVISYSTSPQDELRALHYPFVRGFLSKPVSKDTLKLLYATYSKIK